MTTRTHLKLADKLKIIAAIQDHAKSVGGFCVYDTAWSDERIVEFFGGRYTISNVKRVRKSVMGLLRKKGPTTKREADDYIDQRLARLELATAKILARLEEK